MVGGGEVGFRVRRMEAEMVHGSSCDDNKEKNEYDYYYLSNLDQNIAVVMKTVHVYKAVEGKSTEDVCRVIKDALAKVLEYYYPCEGTLTVSQEGKLIVRCDGRGVPFVEAVADCDLDALGDISIPDPEKLMKLVYQLPEHLNIFEAPLLTVQVTKFKCGGYLLGMANNHCLSDGVAVVEFLRSWAELARGVPLTIRPILDRSIQLPRSPPKIEFHHDEFTEVEDVSNLTDLYKGEGLQHRCFTFNVDKLTALKEMAMRDGAVESCTSFVVLTAFTWRARTKALKMGPGQKTKLLFAVDGRNKMVPPLPAGFYGNGIVLACCLCDAEELDDRPLSYAVEMVQNTIKNTTDAYVRSVIDYFEITRARPSLTGTLLITAWTRLGLRLTDFGWGEAAQTGPAELPQKEVAFFLPHAKEPKSLVLVLGLPASCMNQFEELVENIGQ
ncbi:putative omega-hydroxypalmitate O-feruloyl transferase [Dioscorea sansibarensis]